MNVTHAGAFDRQCVHMVCLLDYNLFRCITPTCTDKNATIMKPIQVISNVGTVATVPAFAVSSPKIRSSLHMSSSDSALKMVSFSLTQTGI